ncbi:MAG: aminodeoxychorismate/anthranilate synthase component II [Methanobacteriaceae archaeon]|jgi:anthranilate synthase component 2|uniref:anthranilate synthase component II n=1 Tax=unclassified Methanobrevibacter TaxID=2638681 RepID=UPI0037591EB4|nr:aminodeoxychorismate/anthranilate synthase component II [Methanobacteriaceae archaeon]
MILLVDNYDSFSYNLYQYLGIAISKINNLDLEINSDDIIKEIKVIRNDQFTINQIKELNPNIIILSPGPGKPSNAGICIPLVKEFQGKIPILGVCLGHQAICEAYGGKISYAKEIMHGKTSTLKLKNDPLFKDLNDSIQAARYHSLALIENTLPQELDVIARTIDDEIMAVKHKNYPIYGLQFHPESILTPEGLDIITNFLKML